MPRSLRSILCRLDGWSYDSSGQCNIIFREDGTGDFLCRAELNVWIAAEFEWNSPSKLDESVNLTSGSSAETRAQLDLEITLTTRVASYARNQLDMSSRPVNERALKDDAFVPKMFHVSLQVGRFKTPQDTEILKTRPSWEASEFSQRLAFDKSPLPPRSEWRKPEAGPEALGVWDWKLFHGERLPGGQSKKGEGCNVQ